LSLSAIENQAAAHLLHHLMLLSSSLSSSNMVVTRQGPKLSFCGTVSHSFGALKWGIGNGGNVANAQQFSQV